MKLLRTVLLSSVIALGLLGAACAFSPHASAETLTSCSEDSVLDGRYFVWDIAANDAQAGLVKRSAPGAGAAPIGVLDPEYGRVSPSGPCMISSDGSVWIEFWDYPGDDKAWINAAFLKEAGGACLIKTRRGHSGLVVPAGPGHVVIEGEVAAFLPYWADNYQFVDKSAVVTNQLCEVYHWHQSPGPVSIGAHTVRGIDAPPTPLTICG